jgi:ssDNA-binding Zn-finger/Zn-ribbon topoisomerase 1
MSFIDSKYIGLISPRLQKFKQVKKDLYNFRCPYCGDSQKYKNKARGYIYQLKNDHNYKCHNCGVSRSFTNFLKDIDTVLYDQYVMERYKNGLTGKRSNTSDPDFNFQKPNFFKDSENSQMLKKFDLPTLAELNKEHFAREYVDQRKIPEKYLTQLYFCEKFKEWTNTQKYTFESTAQDEPRIIIPLINHGEIIGFQGRSLNKNSKIKYITIILNEHAPKMYGLDTVDWNKPIYIVEGPFDSMFIENAIAMVGADFDKMFFITNFESEFIMVYDNEKRNKQIVERMGKAIEWKFPIVIWPSDVQEKDINDMVLSGLDVQNMLECNTYRGLEAKVKLTNWKRV